jgi:phospholipase/carboxylesterase
MFPTAHLHARPSQHITPLPAPPPVGRNKLDIDSQRDSFFIVPSQYEPSRPAPLILLLHGSGGHSNQGLQLLEHLADSNGLILVAPASTEPTWDAIQTRRYGPDVALLDRALAFVFSRYAVDAEHTAIGGFSDGASYALSVGLANGDLFSHVIAFSPGFIAPTDREGKPCIFISHGTQDNVLPINPCSRKIVPRLRGSEYQVMYDEFEGGHTTPPEVAQCSVDWFLGRAGSPACASGA